ncbi:MAG: hydrogenase formation protein HypD [Oscillospiraceae bacterium]|nr:hydrogenase formation protein HypD [Oscillospiraceae bacterium]
MLSEAAFRRPKGADKILRAIRELELPPTRIMEVCGTHTMAIAKSGIRNLLPAHIQLLSGPGCPVCVTPSGVMDEVLKLTEIPDLIVTTYGDLMRVPGSVPGDDLQRRKAMGADVRWVYSPMDALELAKAHPDKQVIFLGVGFETTAPGTALAVLEAQAQQVANFSVLCLLKQTAPALRALLAQPDFRVDGFLCPGHVATVMGAEAFRFLPEEYGLPAVVGGFETGDLLAALWQLLLQIKEKSPRLENEYTRAVSPQGNPAAQAIMAQVLEPVSDVWRGLGTISESGFGLKAEFAAHDAARRFPFSPTDKEGTKGCKCGQIICGQLQPHQCPLFGKACQPDHPVGPCMVSGEGACAAAYKYQRIETLL